MMKESEGTATMALGAAAFSGVGVDAQMSELDPEVRKRTDVLDAHGVDRDGNAYSGNSLTDNM